MSNYDALLVCSFGGPQKQADVMPFLENVLRGRNVPRPRMMAVAEHYTAMGGASPINAQNRSLIEALEKELATHGPSLPIYFGNRNWHPLIVDAVGQMTRDGVKRALMFVTSAYSSYSGCRQYLEDIQLAHEAVGPTAPRIDKLRVFYNHPGFIDPMSERTIDALRKLPEKNREVASIVFSAHSIPIAMAEMCPYEEQLNETCRLVGERIGRDDWSLVYQSRSGPPSQPWLEPDVCEHLRHLEAEGIRDVVVVPIGFLSDHMEVIYDLDTEAKQRCVELGLNMVRADTVSAHPRFVPMIRQLILERVDPHAPRLALGALRPNHDICPEKCCLRGRESL